MRLFLALCLFALATLAPATAMAERVRDLGTFQGLRSNQLTGYGVVVGLQGTGDTRGPLYISIISQIVLPLGICFTIQQLGTLESIHIWIAILVGHMARSTLSMLRFGQGKWREIEVRVK